MPNCILPTCILRNSRFRGFVGMSFSAVYTIFPKFSLYQDPRDVGTRFGWVFHKTLLASLENKRMYNNNLDPIRERARAIICTTPN